MGPNFDWATQATEILLISSTGVPADLDNRSLRSALYTEPYKLSSIFCLTQVLGGTRLSQLVCSTCLSHWSLPFEDNLSLPASTPIWRSLPYINFVVREMLSNSNIEHDQLTIGVLWADKTQQSSL